MSELAVIEVPITATPEQLYQKELFREVGREITKRGVAYASLKVQRNVAIDYLADILPSLQEDSYQHEVAENELRKLDCKAPYKLF